MFLKYQIDLLQLFLKDDVTLDTGEMTDGNSVLPSHE